MENRRNIGKVGRVGIGSEVKNSTGFTELLLGVDSEEDWSRRVRRRVGVGLTEYAEEGNR